MNWPLIVTSLQALNALVWIGVIYQFHMAFVRIVTGRSGERDAAASWLCAFGAAQTAFVLHWLAVGQEDVAARPLSSLYFWAACYAVNALAGVGMSYTLQNNINRQHGTDVPETNRRARISLVIWGVVAVLCFMLASVAASAGGR